MGDLWPDSSTPPPLSPKAQLLKTISDEAKAGHISQIEKRRAKKQLLNGQTVDAVRAELNRILRAQQVGAAFAAKSRARARVVASFHAAGRHDASWAD